MTRRMGYGKSQSLAQASDCGNGFISVADFCQEIGAQNQGKENSVAQSGNQEINVAVDLEDDVVPVPPVELGCPAGTLWDITLVEDNDELGLEDGTVLCLTENRPGNQEATIANTGPDYEVVDVNPTPLPGTGECPPPKTLAVHTSGTAPNAFEQNGELCIDTPGMA